MENILLPSKMTFAGSEKANASVLTIEPLHHGYGTTVGNALRRVLLSSLEGAAVTSVKIKGAQHEFSTVEGVKEDVLQIILNLKQLRMRVHTNEPVTLTINVSGKLGEVTGADIDANADVEIANPDHVLATLTDKKAEFTAEIVVKRGRGYVPTENQETVGNDIGVIAIDAMYSPVVSVGMKVENTRVGEITNYDKLIMDIQTDGTITVQEAVVDAVKVLLNHYNWIDSQLQNATLTQKLATASEEALAKDEVVEESDKE